MLSFVITVASSPAVPFFFYFVLFSKFYDLIQFYVDIFRKFSSLFRYDRSRERVKTWIPQSALSFFYLSIFLSFSLSLCENCLIVSRNYVSSMPQRHVSFQNSFTTNNHNNKHEIQKKQNNICSVRCIYFMNRRLNQTRIRCRSSIQISFISFSFFLKRKTVLIGRLAKNASRE